jgi:hypothetical protein
MEIYYTIVEEISMSQGTHRKSVDVLWVVKLVVSTKSLFEGVKLVEWKVR